MANNRIESFVTPRFHNQEGRRPSRNETRERNHTMKTQITLRQLVSVLMSGILGLGGLCYGVQGQGKRKPVIISFGQPNIWSLEQAHYLLARMHERSLDLASHTPDEVDLDPNATNGSRLSTLKTILEAGVSFDQGLGSQNQLLAQANQHSFARRQTLEAKKDQRHVDLQKVNGELAALNFEREQMNGSGATDTEKKLEDVEIKSKTAEQAALTTEIADINAEIEKNPAPTGTPSAVSVPTPFDKSKFSDSVVDKMLGDEGLKNELRKDVRLAATTMLDNHIQMQYEIIAKQLTLLRDEVGPNERLVFLELPQSLYTTPGKSEEMVAQVWWSVTGVTAKPAPAATSSNASKAAVREFQLAIAEGSDQLSNKKRERDDVESEMRRRIARGTTDVAQLRARSAVLNADITDKQQQLIVLSEELNYAVSRQAADEAKRLRSSRDLVETDPAKLIKTIRSVDLIPRQSSLNVNDVQDTVKSGALTAAFSFLFGLGAKVSYQRQRELYEQYIHQDIFASSFGKGTRDFGWTFGPLPGSKRIAPGIRTTYAVMVIPENVEELKFSVSGCYFPRKQLAPQNFADTANADWKSEGRVGKYRCESPAEQIAVPVPGTRDDSFWVKGVSYKSGVKPGQRITVSLDGSDFSTQTGILVDGVALRPSVGVAQPLLAARKDAASAAGGNGITGEFERLNKNQLVLTFRMPDDYSGTPTITVVSPGRAIDLNSNDILLRINGNPGRLLSDADFMFGKRPDDLALTSLDIFRNPAMGRRVFSVLSGVKLPKDFDPNKVDLRINGVKAVAVAAADKPVVLHAGSDFYQMEFDLPNSDTIDVSIVSEGAYATKSFPNPLRLNITEVSVIASDKKGEDTVLTLKVKGAGFGDQPEIRVKGVMNPSVVPINSGEAAVELKNPPALMVITVTNPDSHASATTLLPRPAAKKEE